MFAQAVVTTYKTSLEIKKLRRELLAQPAATSPTAPTVTPAAPADVEEKVRQAKAAQLPTILLGSVVLCFGLGLSFAVIESVQRSKRVGEEVADLRQDRKNGDAEVASLRSQFSRRRL